MMTDAPLPGEDVDLIINAIGEIEGQPVISVTDWRKFHRLYSVTIFVQANFEHYSGQYVIKTNNKTSESNYTFQTRANNIFVDDKNYIEVKCALVKGDQYLVSKFISGGSLRDRFFFRNGLPHFGWWARLLAAVDLTADWLNKYHQYESTPTCETSLASIFEHRHDLLEALEPDIGKYFEEILRQPLIGPGAVIHGDFSAHNVLLQGARIGVIDYGIDYWRRSSPYWDIATMLVSMQRLGLFSIRSPIWWMPWRMKILTERFVKRYGLNIDSNWDFLRCLALRHLVFSASDNLPDARRRREWHGRQFASIISQLKTIEHRKIPIRRT